MDERQQARTRSFDRVEWGSLDAEQARYLRRRVRFWRNVAVMSALSFGLIAAVYFVRRSGLRDRCRSALEHYSRVAQAMKLADANVATLQLQWRYLDQGAESIPPSHYQLLLKNWAAIPQAGEEI